MSKSMKSGRAQAVVADAHSAVHNANAAYRPAKPARPSLSAYVQELRDKALHKLLPNGVRL